MRYAIFKLSQSALQRRSSASALSGSANRSAFARYALSEKAGRRARALCISLSAKIIETKRFMGGGICGI